MADAVLAFGQDVEKEAPDELVGFERHGGVAAGPVEGTRGVLSPAVTMRAPSGEEELRCTDWPTKRRCAGL